MIQNKKIEASQAYFIKLGEGGRWEDECIHDGVIRIGFHDIDHQFCADGEWERVKNLYLDRGSLQANATRYSNELKRFYTAPDQCLWITFSKRRLWWGFTDGPAYLSAENHKQRNIRNGWSCCDLSGATLDVTGISSKLTQVSGYRGTICEVKELDYLLRRLNSGFLPEVRQAEEAREAYSRSLVPLVRNLTWGDFEILVDMVFSAGGWRRLGVVGKTEKDIDLELEQPVTGERVMVQVKARCDTGVIRDISERIKGLDYKRVFVVTHTFQGARPVEGIDNRLEILDMERLSPLILDAGLSGWLIMKSK